MKTLYIHLGLPKAASTLFQREVFPSLKDIKYVRTGKIKTEGHESINLLIKFIRTAGDLKPLIEKLSVSFSCLMKDGLTVLISNENISLLNMDIWESIGQSPLVCAERLNLLKEELGVDIRILYFYRDLGPWLASRYAQSGNKIKNPCQEDFDERISNLLLRPNPALHWLNADYVISNCFRDFKVYSLDVDELMIGRHCFVKEFLINAGFRFNIDDINDLKLEVITRKTGPGASWRILTDNPLTDAPIYLNQSNPSSLIHIENHLLSL